MKILWSLVSKVFTKNDILYITVMPFMITLIFGDEFREKSGEHYELVRYIILMLIAIATIMYFKLGICDAELKELRDIRMQDKEMSKNFADVYKVYTDDLKVRKEMDVAYDEKFKLLEEKINRLEREGK